MKIRVIFLIFFFYSAQALKHYKTSVFREPVNLKSSKKNSLTGNDHLSFTNSAKSALAISLLFSHLLYTPACAIASPDEAPISYSTNGLYVALRDLENKAVSLQSNFARNGAEFLGKIEKLDIGKGNGVLNFGKVPLKFSFPQFSLSFPLQPRTQSALLTTTVKIVDASTAAKKSSYLDDAVKRFRTWDFRDFGSNSLIKWNRDLLSNPPPLTAVVFTMLGLVIIADSVQDARYVRNLLEERSEELENLKAIFESDQLKHEQSNEALTLLKGESDKLTEDFKALVAELEDKSQQVLALNTTIQVLSLVDSDLVRSLSDEASGLKQQLSTEKRQSAMLAESISKLEADLRFSEQMKSTSEKKILDLTNSQDELISNLKSLTDERFIDARSADEVDVSDIGSFFSKVKASGSHSTSVVASLELENRELRDTVTSYSAKLAEALDNDRKTRLQLDYYNATLLSQADLLRNLSRRLELAEAEISGSAISNVVSDSDGIITLGDSSLGAFDVAPMVDNTIHVDVSQAEGEVIRLVDDLSAENDDLKQRLIDSDERFWQRERDPEVLDASQPSAAKSTQSKRKVRPPKVLVLEPINKDLEKESKKKTKKSKPPRSENI